MVEGDRVVDHLHHQKLAVSVIRQALSDAQSITYPSVGRRQAAVWLTAPHNEMREFWCSLAGLDDGEVSECARRVLAGVGSQPCTTNARPHQNTRTDLEPSLAVSA